MKKTNLVNRDFNETKQNIPSHWSKFSIFSISFEKKLKLKKRNRWQQDILKDWKSENKKMVNKVLWCEGKHLPTLDQWQSELSFWDAVSF